MGSWSGMEEVFHREQFASSWQSKAQLCSKQDSASFVGISSIQWNHFRCPLYLYGWASRNLFSCTGCPWLGRNCSSNSKWHSVHIQRKQVFETKTNAINPLFAAIWHWLLCTKTLVCTNSQPKCEFLIYLQDCTQSQTEIQDFFSSIAQEQHEKPIILSVIQPYNEDFACSSDHLPPLLQGLSGLFTWSLVSFNCWQLLRAIFIMR